MGRVKGTSGFVTWTYRCMLIPLAEFWKQEEGRLGMKELFELPVRYPGRVGSLSSGERLRLKT